MPLVIRNAILYKISQLTIVIFVFILTLIPSDSTGVKNVFCSKEIGETCFPGIIASLIISAIHLLYALVTTHVLLTGRLQARGEIAMPLVFASIWFANGMFVCLKVGGEWETSKTFIRDYFPWTWEAIAWSSYLLVPVNVIEAVAVFVYDRHYYHILYPRKPELAAPFQVKPSKKMKRK